MTVILADKQFNQYYNIDPNRAGLVATIPWATTGEQLFSPHSDTHGCGKSSLTMCAQVLLSCSSAAP
jgi:hypothetical protein